MLKIILIFLLIIITLYCIKNKVIIKFKTFLKRGYIKYDSPFGIYCYHNKQGSSKTQNAVAFLLDNSHYKIYANLKTLKGVEYYYFSGFNTLIDIGKKEHDCIIFYDELFKGLYKGKKMNNQEKEDLMDFMSQMRKRNIICLTTAQEWLEIPIEFRRYVRFDIKCNLFSLFGYPIIIKEFNDTTQIKWDEHENEYISPRIKTIIEHGRKKIVNSYDTFEQISSKESSPVLTFNEYFETENEFSSFSADSLGRKEEKDSNCSTTTNSNCCVTVSTSENPFEIKEKPDTLDKNLLCQVCNDVSDSNLSKNDKIDKTFWSDLSSLDVTTDEEK